MANIYKVIAQAISVVSTDVTLYTVPASKAIIASTLSVCNRNTTGVNSTYRIAVVPSGEALGDKHYIAYDQFIESRTSLNKTIGLTMAAGDKLIIHSDSADLSVSLFGNELSQ